MNKKKLFQLLDILVDDMQKSIFQEKARKLLLELVLEFKEKQEIEK